MSYEPRGRQEDRALLRKRIRSRIQDDEAIQIDVDTLAEVRWDERPEDSMGEPEIGGCWVVHFWDGTSAELPGVPKDKLSVAAVDAKNLLRNKLLP